MVQVAFSLRSQHKLNFNVSKSTTGATTTFTWTASITTSGNTNTPFGTGTYNHSTSPATTYVSGNTNNATNFAYDYRSPNQNYTINLGSGVRSGPADGTNYTFTLAVSMGSLIGSATANVSIAADVYTPSPTAPTSLSASSTYSDKISLSWSGASGSITNYGIWWNYTDTGAPSSGSTPDFTTSSTSLDYTPAYSSSYDASTTSGRTRYHWVRAQGPGGNSAWYPAGNGVYGYMTPAQSRYYFSGEGSDYLSYSDSGLYDNGSTIYLPYATKTGYTFGGWWTQQNSGGSFVGPMGGAFTVGNSSYTNGQTFYAYWYPTEYTLTYDANGGAVSPTSKTIAYNSTYGTLPTPTRSGYSFNGWFTASTGGTPVTSTTNYATASDSTIFAQWTALLPVFSDQQITTTATLNKDINTNIDYTVSAAPVTSFSIVYSGTGLNPSSWLTISKESGTNNGILAGKPTQIGTYTFIVRATNSGGGDTDSSLITLIVNPAGKRLADTGMARLSLAKRFDGAAWVNLKIMRRFDGTAWQDIGNI